MFAAFSEQDGNKLLSIGGLAGYQTSTWITVCNIIAVLFVIIMLIGLLLLFILLFRLQIKSMTKRQISHMIFSDPVADLSFMTLRQCKRISVIPAALFSELIMMKKGRIAFKNTMHMAIPENC